jgi:hypothetical protein
VFQWSLSKWHKLLSCDIPLFELVKSILARSLPFLRSGHWFLTLRFPLPSSKLQSWVNLQPSMTRDHIQQPGETLK